MTIRAATRTLLDKIQDSNTDRMDTNNLVNYVVKEKIQETLNENISLQLSFYIHE